MALSSVWSDYDGDGVYGDFTVDGGYVTEQRSFEPGLATVDPWVASGDANTSYYHSDMIGSTRFMTDSGSAEILSATYTAFGERVCSLGGGDCQGVPNHRYGYAGAWGYQAHDEFPFLHIGHRYYDPSTGRFLQRDPIGIAGGLNVYAYVFNNPVGGIDPSGLWSFWRWAYTGDGNAPDDVYEAARDGAAQWLHDNSPVRGGYAGVGGRNNRGAVAGAGASWTIDDGASVWGGFGVSGSRRGRDPRTGRFESGTFAAGFGASWGEDGFDWGPFAGGGRNQKAHGAHFAFGAGGRFNFGFNFGVLSCGLILDLTP